MKSVPLKTLWLVRHAKSSWDSGALTDHERPINKRGLKDATMMGKRLHQSKVNPEKMISSSALRAQMTARLIAREIGYDEGQIEIDPDIYDAGLRGLIEIVQHLDDSLDQIILIGHNPDITEAVEWLTRAHIGNMPTSAIATLQLDVDRWGAFTQGAVTLAGYDYPKKQPVV